jgi:hypothetical protein
MMLIVSSGGVTGVFHDIENESRGESRGDGLVISANLEIRTWNWVNRREYYTWHADCFHWETEIDTV